MSQASYAELEQLLLPEVREELTPALIADTWASVLTEMGAKESFEGTHVWCSPRVSELRIVQILGPVVGVSTLQHEAGQMMGRVAVDEQLRVTGILIVTPGSTQLPF